MPFDNPDAGPDLGPDIAGAPVFAGDTGGSTPIAPGSLTFTVALGQMLDFSLPPTQGVLTSASLTIQNVDGTAIYGPIVGILRAGAIQTFDFPGTETLPLGVYVFEYDWGLGGLAQTPITGTLVVATAGAYTADYSQWPTTTDVQARLNAAGLTLRPGAADARLASVIAEVSAEVARRTLRQFAADDTDTTRIYDGSGTPELEVDEMVSLTSVTILGLQSQPGYPLSNPELIYEQGKPFTRIVVGQGSVPAWTSEGVWMPFRSIFPSGRRNILITGRFGFAPSIPSDLWHAVCGEMAHRLAGEAIYQQDGRLSYWKGGDESVSFSLKGASELGWHSTYDAAVTLYRRPTGRRLRRLHPPMI